MKIATISCEGFIQALASKEPVPGGGGASALVGAIGTALGNMVGSLTLGKKKYADVQDDIVRLKSKADELQAAFLALAQQDAEVFEPLSKAYGLPKETEQERAFKEKVMEEALKAACEVPLRIMARSCEAIDLMEEFALKGSAIAISDAGCGAACCRAALTAASLNVFINTKSMLDRAYAETAEKQANDMLNKYVPLCDSIFSSVLARLR